MNEELQETLSAVLQKSMEVAEKTGQWALDMAPQLIEQYLMWEFWSSFFISIVCLIYLIPSYKLFPLTVKVWTEILGHSEAKAVGLMFYCIVALISVILFIVNVYTMIFVSVAPEIYLIKNLL